MKPLSIFLIFLLVVCLTALADAQENIDTHTGKHLYKSFCLVCHGPNGDTKGPLAVKLGLTPSNLTDEKYNKKSVDQLAYTIGGYGRPDSNAMPFLWKDEFPQSSIRNIAAYLKIIRSTNISLRGDKHNGKRVYKNSCLACHGPKGTGKGTLAKIIGARKVGFTKGLSIRYLSDNELISVIRDGKGEFMPGWGGTLDDEEIIDTTAYVRSLSK